MSLLARRLTLLVQHHVEQLLAAVYAELLVDMVDVRRGRAWGDVQHLAHIGHVTALRHQQRTDADAHYLGIEQLSH